MRSLSEALALVESTVQQSEVVTVRLGDALGLATAEAIVSTVESPPFDKALMDGYAVRVADLVTGSARLRVLETVTAGRVPTAEVTAQTAVQIMTGAPLPAGADAVVKIEETQRDGDWVVVRSTGVRPEANLIRRATSLKMGEMVLASGTELMPSRIGALAELGQAMVRVHRRPTAAVMATGDELVAVDQLPGPGQIRNSNEPMLVAQLSGMGAVVRPLGVARDQSAELDRLIALGLQGDLLILSGGVSAGQLDLVPSALARAGVATVFHKVDMKPGKPVWFGVAQREPGRATYVFGLPGNPVSSLVCAELFVRTAIRRMLGFAPAVRPGLPATLEHPTVCKGDRPTFHPAVISETATGRSVRLVTWHGSSDLRATAEANGMVSLPTVGREYAVGETIDVYRW